MGVRFRKSINLGPFRINLSKSGIGYSYGVKGLRYTKTADGRDRVTTSIPGTGISHVSESSRRKKSSPRISTRDMRQRQEIMEHYHLSEKKMQKLERDAMLHHDKFVRLAQSEEKMDRYIRKHYCNNTWKTIGWIILVFILFSLIFAKK